MAWYWIAALIFSHLLAFGFGALWYKHWGYDLDMHDDDNFEQFLARQKRHAIDRNNPANF